MKTQLKLAALALALLTINAQFSTAFAQGNLTPPGAPAPTMKSLDQIEARTPISSAPFTITQPGSYYLTTNVSVSLGNAITINASGVTLDLNGFTISSTEASPAGIGVLLNGGVSDIAIINGHIRGGVTNNAGTFSGPGFGYGIYYLGQVPANVRVTGISVSGCLYYGIDVGFQSAVVESCTVQTVGSDGIIADDISRCTAYQCGAIAIDASETVANCYGNSTGSYGLYATTANNSYGVSSSYTGLYANNANNCYGASYGGTGLYAAASATGCYGYSNNGDGIYVTGNATGCYGYGVSDGIYAYNAMNCYGIGINGYGMEVNDLAMACYGDSVYFTGLYAYIANSCFGNSESIFYKYNMP